MSSIPKPQEIYKHFKGKLYQIITIAQHCDTEETLVIYQAMYDDFKIYARELTDFMSPVDTEKYPDASQVLRFELVTEVNRHIKLKETARIKESQPEEQEGKQEINQKVIKEMEPALDPMLLEFLDADTYEQRLNILTGLHYRITDEMITTMAIACDVEVAQGELEERFNALKTCLLTLDKYECNRMR